MKERLDATVRREQIAEAAMSIVVDQGLGAVTVRNVARIIGVTAPALYRHYRSKAAILAEVMDVVEGLKAENMKKAREQAKNPLGLLRNVFRGHIWLIQRYRGLPLLYLSDALWFEAPEIGLRVRQRCNAEMEELSAIILKGQELGEIRGDLAPRDIYHCFLGLFVTLGLMYSRQMENLDFLHQADVNWKLFEKAVAA
jgi:AcrR family transcriptional regulator